jgi:hypothetical protein
MALAQVTPIRPPEEREVLEFDDGAVKAYEPARLTSSIGMPIESAHVANTWRRLWNGQRPSARRGHSTVAAAGSLAPERWL